MVKRMLLMVAVAAAATVAVVPEADAGVFVRRVAPVRRAARVALPPYPIARRAVVGPVYRPYAYRAYQPVIYGGPMFYGPGVMVGVGY